MRVDDSSNTSISIVIPNYNNERYIEKCIRSVLLQTYSNIKEIIVVDDASTDKSKDIINSLAAVDNRIIPIFLEQNSKVSAARNAGLSKVTSEYVSFLDGDDYYFNSNKIENEMTLLNGNYNAEPIVYSYIVRASSDDSILSWNEIPDNRLLVGNIYHKLLLSANAAFIMRDYIVKTDYIREVGAYNESRYFFEDLELIIKLSRNAQFLCTKEFGTAYRLSENGLSNRPYIEQLLTINEIICQEINHLPLIKRLFYRLARFFIINSKLFVFHIKSKMQLYD